MADEATERISRRGALLGMTAAGVGAGALAFPSIAAAETVRPQYNVQEAAYRALGDGRTDDAAAIQAAINAANAAGGGIVYFPAGTYIVGTTLTLYSRIYLVGAGVDATRLKLRDRANTDLITSSGYAEQIGTGKWEVGIEFAGLMDLTLHGNKENNTSGTGFKHYGRRLVIRNATISYCKNEGISSERGFGGDEMEAHVSGLIVRDCEGTGIDWRGPHDSTFVNVHVIRSGSMGIRLRGGTGSVRGGYGGAGAMFLNTHVWGEPQTKAWELEQGCFLTQCSGEGASESALHIKANDCVIVGGNYYANESGAYAIKHGETGIRPRRTIIQGLRAGQARTADVNFVADGGHGMFHFVIEKGRESTAHTGTPDRGSSQWFISIDDPAGSPEPWSWSYTTAFGGINAYEVVGRLEAAEGYVLKTVESGRLGFHSASPIAKPTVTGSRGGNVALANLLTALANYGLITNSTT